MQGILFVLVVILVAFFFINKSDQESKKGKIIFVVFIAILVIFAISYESFSSSDADKTREKLVLFNQGKTLSCKEIEVNNKTFIYVSGTQSFVGKPENKSVGSLVFDIKDCDTK